MRLSRPGTLLASAGGIGYAPILPGTAGSLAGLLLGCLVAPSPDSPQPYPAWLLLSLAATFLVGVVSSTMAERELRLHDPACVVIDEVWGMWAVVAALPSVATPVIALVAFGLFRAFDIIKPPPLRWLARCPGGWGIMLDDAGAAAYTVLVFHLTTALR